MLVLSMLEDVQHCNLQALDSGLCWSKNHSLPLTCGDSCSPIPLSWRSQQAAAAWQRCIPFSKLINHACSSPACIRLSKTNHPFLVVAASGGCAAAPHPAGAHRLAQPARGAAEAEAAAAGHGAREQRGSTARKSGWSACATLTRNTSPHPTPPLLPTPTSHQQQINPRNPKFNHALPPVCRRPAGAQCLPCLTACA